MDKISKWSDDTFNNGNFTRTRSLSIAHHLKKEVKELIKSIDIYFKTECSDAKLSTHEEFADVFMLVLDAATHFGIDADKLIAITHEKLEINKKRKWGTPDKNGVVEHIRDQQKI